ncbi:MAG: MBL fold metallo-hydrolase [Thaumarchaeota archaeon]|nr:MBL fold metallo-hydrolase [Nitrososphaerota archaeon]
MTWSFGRVKVHWLGHDSFVLVGSKTIVIDPFQAKGDYKADVLLISHEHGDHLSPDDIKRFRTPSTRVIAPKVAQSELSKLDLNVAYLPPNSKTTLEGVTVETLPAYNLTKFREPGKVFHPKEDGRLGFIVTLDGVRFYHAGDTDAIPEMKTVDVDVALLPVSGTYVMTADEAAQAAGWMKAKVLVPMHIGSVVGTRADAEKFRGLIGNKAEVVILEKEG